MKLLDSLCLFPDLLIKDNRYFQTGTYELTDKRFYIGKFKILKTKFGLILSKPSLNIFITNYSEIGLIISIKMNGGFTQVRSTRKKPVDNLNQWIIFLIEYNEKSNINDLLI